MKQLDRNPEQTRHLSTRHPGVVAAVLLALGLLAASSASAAYEQVGNFAGTPGILQSNSGTPNETSARWPEEVQLSGVGGMAVNVSGAGGVPPGTLYAATQYGFGSGYEKVRVARFNPDGSFSENWTISGNPHQERCGPGGEPTHPMCQSRWGDNAGPIDVDVDQTTGYVYLFWGGGATPGENRIQVYSADGSKLIAEFGASAAAGETTGASPGKIHGNSDRGSIAVDATGRVYVYDQDDSGYRRLMTFEPQSPGDYEHYVYAGQGHDIVATSFQMPIKMPIADAAGDLYVAGGPLNNTIAKLDPSQPVAPQLCEFKFPKGQIQSITVIPTSGEVFFYASSDKKIHRLAACDESGEFAEAGTFGFSPARFEFSAMAFNPTRQFSPGRPAGVLYAGAPGGGGGKTEKKAGENFEESALGYIFALPEELSPEVKSESVVHVSATTAELGAQINPKGPPTDYTFQYITEAEYEANEPADRFAGANEAPPGGGLLGEGPLTLSAAASLTGLSPGTTYHYRAVATSHCSVEDAEKVCEGVGADQVFHTFPVEAPGLPDKRAYELVSPAEKQGGQVFPADPSISSCGVEAACKPGETQSHFPMQSRPDGDAIVYEGTPFSDGEGAVSENQYLARRDAKAGWQTINPTPPLLEGAYEAFNTGLSQGLLRQRPGSLLSLKAPAEYENLYAQLSSNPLALSPLLEAEPPNRPGGGSGYFELRYAGVSADLSRVFFEANDALTEETPSAPEAVDGGAGKFNLYEWAEGQLALVNVLPGNTETVPGAAFGEANAHAVSTSGSRVFWSDGSGQAYVREDAETTRAIPDPGKFLSASVSGSKVLLDNGHLYDLETEATTDLTAGKGGFQGIAGQSDDLSRVYFVGTEVLSGEEENSEGATAQAGKFNLYAWSAGATRFVATLVAGDNGGTNFAHSHDWSPRLHLRTAEASSGGEWLAFLSEAPITGYDNTGPCEANRKGGYIDRPCPEAFLYDSATGELTCASCNPSGARPLGWSVLRLIKGGERLPQPRYLTDDGRLYFDSRDSLSPFDTNEGFEDVYEYEPQGAGTCERAGGCVSLLSAGSEPGDSNLLAVDEDGDNVFFTTRDQLVLKDHDDLIDLYDARVEGGIPSETEVARGECQGEACAAALTPPNDPTPGSSSFEGAGNVDEGKATKKHKKKKHAKKHKSNKRAHKRAAKHNRGGAK